MVALPTPKRSGNRSFDNFGGKGEEGRGDRAAMPRIKILRKPLAGTSYDMASSNSACGATRLYLIARMKKTVERGG